MTSKRPLPTGTNSYIRDLYKWNTQISVKHLACHEPFPPFPLFGLSIVICDAPYFRFTKQIRPKLVVGRNGYYDSSLCSAFSQIYRPYRRPLGIHIADCFFLMQFWVMQSSSYAISLIPIPCYDSARVFVLWRTNMLSLFSCVFSRKHWCDVRNDDKLLTNNHKSWSLFSIT